MRVIAGTARGRRLKAVPGDAVRPITDRVKESLFNILRPDMPGATMLDLFAGTGSVGIEALSRGAQYVRFIDRNRAAIKVIHENLAATGLEEHADVFNLDAFALLDKQPNFAFDYIYIAPPQYKELWSQALLKLDAVPDWLVEDGWVIVQIDPLEYQEHSLENLEEFDQRRYGNTLLVFYERKQVGDE
jgi:16S rRNA (guanine(966)-N(2))-methyltransferase RsmD